MVCIAAFNINEPWPCDCFTPNKIRFLPFLLLSFVGDALPYAERVGLWVKMSGFYSWPGHCDVFSGETLYLLSVFPHPGVYMGTNKLTGKPAEMQGGGGRGALCLMFAFFSVFYPEWRKSGREGESVDGCSERWYASTLWTSKYWTDSPFLFIVRDISCSVVCIVCIEMSYSGICLSVGFSFCLLFYLPVCRSSCVCRTDFLSVGLCTCLSFLAISRWSSYLSP